MYFCLPSSRIIIEPIIDTWWKPDQDPFRRKVRRLDEGISTLWLNAYLLDKVTSSLILNESVTSAKVKKKPGINAGKNGIFRQIKKPAWQQLGTRWGTAISYICCSVDLELMEAIIYFLDVFFRICYSFVLIKLSERILYSTKKLYFISG